MRLVNILRAIRELWRQRAALRAGAKAAIRDGRDLAALQRGQLEHMKAVEAELEATAEAIRKVREVEAHLVDGAVVEAWYSGDPRDSN